jgi:tetratricopeptide (TPR) repeat protein
MLPCAAGLKAMLVTIVAASVSVGVALAQPRPAPAPPPSELSQITRLISEGQLDAALARAEAHLQSNPRDAQVRFQRGLIFTDLKRPTDAIAVFEALTQEFPELPEPYNNLAVLHAGQGRHALALSLLQQAIRAQPNYVTAHENLGDLYVAMATETYRHAAQLDPNNRVLQAKLTLARDTETRLRTQR